VVVGADSDNQVDEPGWSSQACKASTASAEQAGVIEGGDELSGGDGGGVRRGPGIGVTHELGDDVAWDAVYTGGTKVWVELLAQS